MLYYLRNCSVGTFALVIRGIDTETFGLDTNDSIRVPSLPGLLPYPVHALAGGAVKKGGLSIITEDLEL